MHTVACDERGLLRQLGRRVRDARLERGVSRRMLAGASGVSERYLAQLEGGLANASIIVLQHVADALDLSLARLLGDDAGATSLAAPSAREARARRVALIGLRGAGKSTLGKRLASKLRVPFLELDREIEREAGISIGAIFELYGQAGFRRLERTCLDAVLREHPEFVLAAGGSIVSERSTFERLLEMCFTIWLRATPGQHMERVVAQGDMRPMSGNPRAMDDLKRILEVRRPLYERADRVVDTSRATVAESLEALWAALPVR